jgi:thiamine biosynthesis lipoprotein ApbE
MKRLLALLCCLALLACASAPAPDVELSRARSALDMAKTEQIARYAPVELRLATDALQTADGLVANRKFAQARAQAERSEVYSELAQVKAEAASARAAVAEKTAEIAERKRAIEAASSGALPALPLRPSQPQNNDPAELR